MPDDVDGWVPDGSPPDLLPGDVAVLRRWEVRDAALMHQLITGNVDHLRPWMPWVSLEPLALSDRQGLLAQWDTSWQSRCDFAYLIVRDGEPAGSAGLHCRQGPGILEIGYWVSQNQQGIGVATEAAILLAHAAMHIEGVDSVEIHHDLANTGSGRVAEKAGFRKSGTYARAPQAPGDSGTAVRWVFGRG